MSPPEPPPGRGGAPRPSVQALFGLDALHQVGDAEMDPGKRVEFALAFGVASSTISRTQVAAKSRLESCATGT